MTLSDLTIYFNKHPECKDVIALLKTIPEDILSRLVVSTSEPGTVLAYAGDNFHSVYIFLDGELKLSYELSDEFVYTFATLNAICFLGETETFTDHPVYKATISCHNICKYIVIPKSLFLNWIKRDVDTLYQMTSYFARKYTGQVRQDRTFLSASGEDRFIYLLLRYYDTSAKNGICHITTPKEALADEVCVSLKTISRCIASLKQNNLISTEGHHIVMNETQYNHLQDAYSYLFT